MRRLIPAFFLVFLVAAAARADVLYLKDGRTLRGLVVEEHWDRLVLSTEEGERPFLRRDVEEIFYDEPERNQLYLGRLALAMGNTALAEGFFRKALQMHPALREAEDAMGRLEDLRLKRGAGGDFPEPLEALEARLGLTLDASGSMARVEAVRPDSPADRAGLTSGDGLIRYWDESLLHMSPERIAERFLGPSGSSFRLTVQRVPAIPQALPDEQDWPGLELAMERDGLTATEVRPGGMAALAGLLPGDRVVRLERDSTRYMPLGEARKRLRESARRGIILTIQRDISFNR